MKAAVARVLIVSSLVAAHGLASAGPHYYQPPPPPHHHHHHHRGPHLGKWALGLAVAVPLIAIAEPRQPGAWAGLRRTPAAARAGAGGAAGYAPAARRRWSTRAMASPISRWNLTSECKRLGHHQQAAMADATVFQRAVEACMDGRGYTPLR